MMQQQQLFMMAFNSLQNTLASVSPASTMVDPSPSTSRRVGVCPTSQEDPSASTSSGLQAHQDHINHPHQQLPHRLYSPPTATATSSDHYGEHLPIVYRPTPRPLRTTAAPLGHNIPPPLKLKIWQHKFVEFADLISNNRSTDYTLDLTTEDGQPQFCLASRKRKNLTQNEWCQAMDTFISIYIDRYPTEIKQILSYAQTVKDLMQNKANWVWYDTQFRTDREFTLCPWDEIRQDLELRAFRQPQPSDDKSFRSQGAKSRHREDQVPTGYCFAYHAKSQRCNNSKCTFKHTCPKCHAPHPQFLRCNPNRTSSSPNRSRGDNDKRDRPAHTDTREPRKAK